jgi:hypothetical protein
MKRSIWVGLILVSFAAVLLAGCGAGAPRMIRAEQELKAGPNTAMIVFLSPMVVGGHVQLWDGEKFIGFIQPRTSVSYLAKPGEHTFLLRDENWQIVKGRLAAGKTYYVKLEMRVGVGYYSSGTRVSVEVLDSTDRRIKEWKQTLMPVQLADESKAEAFAKKNVRHVTKAMNNVESGKATYISLNPQK